MSRRRRVKRGARGNRCEALVGRRETLLDLVELHEGGTRRRVHPVVGTFAFYTRVLDMELIQRPDLGFPGAWLRSGQQEVHLLGIQSTEPPREQHFAFEVADLDQVISTVRGAGFRCSEPREIPKVCRQAFTHDPSGNMVEFNQRLTDG